MDEQYEYALAMEGLTPGMEDQWIAHAERVVLSPDAAAKLAVADAPKVATGMYERSMGVLLQVQEMLALHTEEGDRKAEAVLTEEKASTDERVASMKAHGWIKKAKRIACRYALMQVEVAKRMSKPKEEIRVGGGADCDMIEFVADGVLLCYRHGVGCWRGRWRLSWMTKRPRQRMWRRRRESTHRC